MKRAAALVPLSHEHHQTLVDACRLRCLEEGDPDVAGARARRRAG